MQLFYAPDITPPLYTLSEEESKHCVRVLRLGRGDTLHITDGRGNLFCCQITDDNPKRCTVRVTTTQAQWEPLPYRLVMAVAPTKNADRFEWFLEKATEVGVSAIVPLETEHSERRVFKPERAGKVITAAMKQSLKAYRPELHPLTPFREAAARPFDGRKFIAHCAPALSPQAKSTCPRRSAKARRRWSSSAPKAISRPRRSLSRAPTGSRRSPSARSACAPKPQPSSPRSWRRWPTPDNKTAGRGAQPPRNPAPAARLQHCRIK